MSAIRDDRAAIDEEVRQLRTLGDLTDDDALENGDGQRLLDFGDELNLKVQGTAPTRSEIKIRSLSLPIKGQLERGQTGSMLITWRCGEVAFKGEFDGDGRDLSPRRHHTVTPISVVPISEEQANRALGLE